MSFGLKWLVFLAHIIEIPVLSNTAALKFVFISRRIYWCSYFAVGPHQPFDCPLQTYVSNKVYVYVVDL